MANRDLKNKKNSCIFMANRDTSNKQLRTNVQRILRAYVFLNIIHCSQTAKSFNEELRKWSCQSKKTS
jgi:hypothetical protein